MRNFSIYSAVAHLMFFSIMPQPCLMAKNTIIRTHIMEPTDHSGRPRPCTHHV